MGENRKDGMDRWWVDLRKYPDVSTDKWMDRNWKTTGFDFMKRLMYDW